MVDNKVSSNADTLDPEQQVTFGEGGEPTFGPVVEGAESPPRAHLWPWVDAALAYWRGLSLIDQFLAIATLLVCVSMLIIGQWLSGQISAGQIKSRAESGGLYMQGFLAPHVTIGRDGPEISNAHRDELDHMFRAPGLSARVEGIRIWRRDGTVIYSTAKTLTGKRVLSADVERAFAGTIVAQLEEKPDDEYGLDRSYPLLEIYAPIYSSTGSTVVAVGEFYERAGEFIHTLQVAQHRTWAIVGATSVGLMTLLFLVFRKADKLISSQHSALVQQLTAAQKLASQNRQLSVRAYKLRNMASQANERFLNRIGADLHDGPIQLLTLLILRLGQASRKATEKITSVKKPANGPTAEALAKQVLSELRELSNNLVLPEIGNASLQDALRLAISRHERATGTTVVANFKNLPEDIDRSLKILLFRVIQEGLNNAFRHGQAKEQTVIVSASGNAIVVSVSDAGPGPGLVQPVKQPGRAHPLGLQGLRNRVDVFGGSVTLKPREPRGAVLMVEIPIDGMPA